MGAVAVAALLMTGGLWSSRMMDIRHEDEARAAHWRREARMCRSLAAVEAANGEESLARDYRRWAEGSERVAAKWDSAASRPWANVVPDPSRHPR